MKKGTAGAPLRALIVSISVLVSAGCSAKKVTCSNQVRSEALSPDGRQKVVVFSRKCSDDDQSGTHVSLLPAKDSLPDGNGNILGSDHPLLIRAAWQDNSKVVIYSYSDLSKTTHLDRAGNVTVEYSQLMDTDLVTPPSSGNQ
jgi:hypothetical protein